MDGFLSSTPAGVIVGIIAAALFALFLWLWLRARGKGEWEATKHVVKTPFSETTFKPKSEPAPAATAPLSPAPGTDNSVNLGDMHGGIVAGGESKFDVQRDQIGTKNVTGDEINAAHISTLVKDSTVYLTVPPVLAGSAVPSLTVTQFVDRGKIMADLRAAIRRGDSAAIVGVQGMGGIGKTELAKVLARELEHEFPNSVMWIGVNERPLEAVHADMARALGVTFPPNLDDEGRHHMLNAAYGGAKIRLVVLDDIRKEFEPNLQYCLPPVPPAVLITSRRRDLPGLPAGALHELDVMDETQALALLKGIERVKPLVEREPAAAAALCERCGYHPLALNLAAKRLLKHPRRSSGPIQDFNAVELDLLSRYSHGAGKGENLRDNLALSYDELDEAARGRFARLAVFAPSGFSVTGAAAVWDETEKDAGETLERLYDAGMVRDADGGRFSLHDLLREYAREQLAARGEEEITERRHAEFLIALFARHELDDLSSAPGVFLEKDNLIQAAEWAKEAHDGNLLARLATTPYNWLYIIFRINNEWLDWLTRSLELGMEDKGLKANVRKAIGDVRQFQDDRDAALASYEQALALYQAVGDKLGKANTLKAIGDIRQFQGDRDAALDNYEQALALYKAEGGEAVGSKLGEANVRKAIGDVRQFQDDRVAALASYEQALALYKAVGSKPGEANVLAAQGQLYLVSEPETADAYLAKAIEIYQSVGSRYSVAAQTGNYGWTLRRLGHRDRARPYLVRAADLFQEMGLDDYAERHRQAAQS